MEYKLKTPLSESDVRTLRIGDIVYLSGTIYTARDQAHRRILEIVSKGGALPVDFRGMAIYHCGPIVKKVNEEWIVIAAGPTTSTRMELYEYDVIRALGVRMIVGKGGMGFKTAEACKAYGAVYTEFTGGAAVLAAQSIIKVKGVEWLDLGMPEALWILEVENFGPLTVVIDSYGANIHENINKRAYEKMSFILK
ncbi:MAG: FumA C-terminus/TtdB family hydratase beta subunit [Candidatus Methanomethylicia archaeon]